MDDEKKSMNEQNKKEMSVYQRVDAILQCFSASARTERESGQSVRYGEKWVKNDVLCCLVNINKKYIEFFLNNKSMGIAFKDIKFDGNIYISITLTSGTNCILLNNQVIDINDESKWEIEGDIDINDNANRIKMQKKMDHKVNIDELKEGDKVIIRSNNEIIESEIDRINNKTRKILVRMDGWKWISMDSDRLFPSKEVLDEMKQNITKLGRKLHAIDNFPTATLKIAINSLGLGEFKYEVLICSHNVMQIGFSDDSFKPNSVKVGCGDDAHSWAFDGSRVKKWGKQNDHEQKEQKEIYDIIPKDFIYDYKKDYTHAINRALHAALFDVRNALKWFAQHWKEENIYSPFTQKELEDLITRHKQQGNKFYKMKEYAQAIAEYDKCICYGCLMKEKPAERHICFSNRSLAFSKVHEYGLALRDAEVCLIMDKTWSKGYLRKGHALMKLYKFDQSIEAYKQGIQLCNKSTGNIVNEQKLLKIALNTAIKYKEIMLAKDRQKEKIKVVFSPLPTKESMRKEIEDGIKKVENINISYGKMFTFKGLIRFDTFGWEWVEDEKDCKQWKCGNYPAVLTMRHYKKACAIKKKPIDVNMFSIRHIQRDNLLASGINSGIILSENFKVCKEPSIYGIEVLIKTIIVEARQSSGYIYWIQIPFQNEYFELKLETTYEGQTTGKRDSMMLMLLSNALKINPMEMMKMDVWNEDPYDSLCIDGALMNLSERQEYDKIFPYHPLSILRAKLMTQLKNSVKINSQKASKMELL